MTSDTKNKDRIIIRIFEEEDFNPLLDLMTDSEVMKFIGPRRAMKNHEVKI